MSLTNYDDWKTNPVDDDSRTECDSCGDDVLETTYRKGSLLCAFCRAEAEDVEAEHAERGAR